MADKYILRVTAGSTYDLAAHTEVPVNTPETVRVSTDLIDVEVNVRVQNYGGLPRDSPATSPYFAQEPHALNNDQYSIALRFTPKRPLPAPATADADAKENDDDAVDPFEQELEDVEGISGDDLQWGNDFDHPIRDRLPPGFGTAMNIIRWWIDPGLEGDPYADSPYLYGPALSSFNAIHVGPGTHDEEVGGLHGPEGGDEAGLEARAALGTPPDGKGRMKWALRADNKSRWRWEYGQTYVVDFFNPYLDFSEFALRLPGFQVPIMKYWDGQGLRPNPKRSHQLRYVLRNRSTGDVYLVVLFTLHLREDVGEDGRLKPEALALAQKQKPLPGDAAEDGSEPAPDTSELSQADERAPLEESRRQLSAQPQEEDTGVDNDDVD